MLEKEEAARGRMDSLTEEESELPESSAIIVGLGELIWDLLPAGKQLGGAPANFAYISCLLGNESIVASRIGADDPGREALARLEQMNVSTRYLQIDASHPTGTVRVELDARGEARFAMNEDSAWDYLEWTESWRELAGRADGVCFGTLGQRAIQARRTIIRFLEQTRPRALRVFDVNLRHSFFDVHMLNQSLELATIVKLNLEELSTIAAMLNLPAREDETIARQLLERFSLELIAVTRGGRGSLLVAPAADAVEHPGFRVEVKDTIGAGDAFLAALVHFYLRRAPLPFISEAANRMGSWVATQAGATPATTPQMLSQMFADLRP